MGKIEPEVSLFKLLLFWALVESQTAINTCLEEMEEFKERDVAFMRDWHTKKDLQKLWPSVFCF